MQTDLFDFDLPGESIALRPAEPRDSAKLLELSSKGQVLDHTIRDLPNCLQDGDVLVLNETKVINAALSARRPARAHGGGGDVSIQVNLYNQTHPNTWQAFVRPAKRLQRGDLLMFSHDFQACVDDKREGGDITLEFNRSGPALAKAIEQHGQPPLPPYIRSKREPDKKDLKDYQTIYAKEQGSIAAPTAGLHFTPDLFEALDKTGIQVERLTLHVGAGTFLPVKSDDTDNHDMHSEWFSINEDTATRLNQAKSDGRRIIAVGTTALRALESAASGGQINPQSQDTDIFITPGYEFQFIDGLLTNFHLPRSTLFMLVCSLCGIEVMQRAYAHAIHENYRFYSYGDASLLWKHDGHISI